MRVGVPGECELVSVCERVGVGVGCRWWTETFHTVELSKGIADGANLTSSGSQIPPRLLPGVI